MTLLGATTSFGLFGFYNRLVSATLPPKLPFGFCHPATQSETQKKERKKEKMMNLKTKQK